MEVAPPKGGSQAIAVMAAEDIPVQVACRVLDVSESGYYAWRIRPPSPRAIRHAWLTDLIVEVHQRLPRDLRRPRASTPSSAWAAGSWSATTRSSC